MISKTLYADCLKELIKFEGCLKEEFNHADPPYSWLETKQALEEAINIFDEKYGGCKNV